MYKIENDIQKLSISLMDKQYDSLLETNNGTSLCKLFSRIYYHTDLNQLATKEFYTKLYAKIEQVIFNSFNSEKPSIDLKQISKIYQIVSSEPKFFDLAFQEVLLENNKKINIFRLVWIYYSKVMRVSLGHWDDPNFKKIIHLPEMNFKIFKKINSRFLAIMTASSFNISKKKSLSYCNAVKYFHMEEPIDEMFDEELGQFLYNSNYTENKYLYKKIFIYILETPDPQRKANLFELLFIKLGFKISKDKDILNREENGYILNLSFSFNEDEEWWSAILSNLPVLIDLSDFDSMNLNNWIVNQELFFKYLGFTSEIPYEPKCFISKNLIYKEDKSKSLFFERIFPYSSKIYFFDWSESESFFNSENYLLIKLFISKAKILHTFILNEKELENNRQSQNKFDIKILEEFLKAPSIKRLQLGIFQKSLKPEIGLDFLKKAHIEQISINIDFNQNFENVSCHCKHLFLAELSHPELIEIFLNNNSNLQSVTFSSNLNFDNFTNPLFEKKIYIDSFGIYSKEAWSIIRIKKRKGEALNQVINKKQKL